MRYARDVRAISLIVIGGALAGCVESGHPPIDSPEATLDAADAIEAEASFLYAILQGTEHPSGIDAELLAGIAATVPVRWQPAGCAQVSQPSSTRLAFTFDDCSGPRGLVHVSGTLDLFLQGWAEAPVIDFSSPSLSANGSTIALSATALAGVWPGGIGIDGQLGSVAVGPRGTKVDGRGSYVMTWQPTSECSTLQASTESDMDVVADQPPHLVTRVDMTRCPGGCPSGVVTRHFPNETEVQVTMDGTALAPWTSRGTATNTRSGVLDLQCE